MSSPLLEIQSREMKFIFEPKKQSNCSVQLVNITDQHVAFKVKTTSPKKYCVRPNIGVILPQETCEFVVTMQALRSAPPDMICRDKFLVQSTIVPAGTMEADLTSEMFSKDSGQYIEERKLKVTLVCSPHSPEVSPMSGTGTQKQAYSLENSAATEDLVYKIEKPPPENLEDVKESKTMNYQEQKTTQYEAIKQAEAQPFTESVSPGAGEPRPIKAALSIQRDREEKTKTQEGIYAPRMKDVEDIKLAKAVKELKSKLFQLEIQLSKAELKITELGEEKRLTMKETENLRRDMALLKASKIQKTLERGYPALFVCLVALISIVFGLCLHP